MAIDLRKLEITPESLGKTFLLVGQSPYYEYVDGKRSDKVLGQAFDVAIMEQGLEKVRVKIAKPGLELDMKDQDMIQVIFDNLTVHLYQDFRNNNRVVLTATATGIHIAK